MGDHNKGIARSWNIANNRAQVVRSHTGAIRDPSQVSYKLSPARSILWRRFPTSVSATCRTASVSRYSLRPTNTPHQVLQCVQDSSVALSRIGDYSHCSFPLLILVLAILFATNGQSFVSVLLEEFQPFGHGQCYMRDGQALVELACKPGHAAFVVMPIKKYRRDTFLDCTVSVCVAHLSQPWPRHVASSTALQVCRHCNVCGADAAQRQKHAVVLDGDWTMALPLSYEGRFLREHVGATSTRDTTRAKQWDLGRRTLPDAR